MPKDYIVYIANDNAPDFPKVAITRPTQDAKKFSDLLKFHEFKTTTIPLLKIKFLARKKAVEKLVGSFLPTHYIFTSANGVRALAKNHADKNIQVITIGSTTKMEAKRLGYKNIINAAEDGKKSNLEILVKFLKKNYSNKTTKFLYVSGDITSGDLKSLLLEQKYLVEKIVLYKSVAAENFIEKLQKQLTAGVILTFFSVRTAKIFADEIDKFMLKHLCEDNVAVVASNKIKEVLQNLNFADIKVAKYPSNESFLEAIKTYARKYKHK
jgi:uroporphyrinogen-III synthase